MRRLLTTLLTLSLLGLASLMLIPAALGMHRYVIVSGSMTGTYDRGSIVYDRARPVSSLAVGDVITYAPPASAHTPHPLVTHRIAWVGRDRSGHRAFRTKGDANATPDPWRFVLDAPTQDEVAFSIPYMGYAFAALGLPAVRMAALGLPALAIMLWVLAGVWKSAGQEVRRREAAAATAATAT
jgi:signal peptidase